MLMVAEAAVRAKTATHSGHLAVLVAVLCIRCMSEWQNSFGSVGV